MIEGAENLVGSLEAWVQGVEKMTLKEYRRRITELYKFILQTTPQATGRAVGNWRIGVNAPDNTWDPDMGDKHDYDILTTKDGKGTYVHRGQFREKGDFKWIEEALHQLDFIGPNRLKLTDVVYITNNVQGDTDNGASSINYLASLQDPGYWSTKLREVNQPYIVVAEALLIVSQGWGTFMDMGTNHIEDYV